MSADKEVIRKLQDELKPYGATLVAVSKTKPVSDIREAMETGQVDFGENYVNELVSKYEDVDDKVRWHFIGHLQSNKVKYIAPFVTLIHGVDSKKLLLEVSRQAQKTERVIDVLLQVHIAKEETKFGLSEVECMELYNNFLKSPLTGVSIKGLMGMASFTDDLEKVRSEFRSLRKLYENLSAGSGKFTTLSMGMTGDYKIALEEGSNMVRIGSLIFGSR